MHGFVIRRRFWQWNEWVGDSDWVLESVRILWVCMGLVYNINWCITFLCLICLYLQIHFPPYIFECFLNAPVHDENSAAQIGNGVVVFKLEKHESEIWDRLQHPDAGKGSSIIDKIFTGHWNAFHYHKGH